MLSSAPRAACDSVSSVWTRRVARRQLAVFSKRSGFPPFALVVGIAGRLAQAAQQPVDLLFQGQDASLAGEGHLVPALQFVQLLLDLLRGAFALGKLDLQSLVGLVQRGGAFPYPQL